MRVGPWLISSRLMAVKRMSKMAFQLDGLGTSPCPVPRSAVNASRNWLTVDDVGRGWWAVSTQA